MKLPIDFKNKYRELMGEVESEKFFDSFDNEITHGFRINPLKEKVIDEDLSKPIKYTEFGYYGKINGKSVNHQSGAIYSQEPSAMLVGEVAKPQLNEKVLDLCAAPGGKSTHLISYMHNTGLLVSNEIDYKRSKVLTENVERFGATNTVVTNSDPKTLAKKLPNFFDRILVDAPCSGEGMFRKNPDAMDYWNLDYPVECAKRQREILIEANKMLKPGGELIYSTCTFAPEEDEQIIAWLVDNFDYSIDVINKTDNMNDGRPEWANNNPDLQNCVRLFPHNFNGEGHFIAKLTKSNSEIKSKKLKPFKLTQLSKEQTELLNEFINLTFKTSPKFTNLVCFGDELFALPNEVPDLSKIKISRLGLHLGTFKKKRFEPSYALSLAVKPDQISKILPISEEEWQKYVHGETLSVDPSLEKGWYLLTCQGQGIGFSKVVNSVAKNFFPKGLRFAIKKD